MSATNLNTSHDLKVAVQSIAEADDGSGNVVDRDGNALNDASNSMVSLVHSENPIPVVDWNEFEKGIKIPVVAMRVIPPIENLGGTPERLEIPMQFDAFAPEGKGSVASALANRLQDVLNYNNFSDEGLEVSVVLTGGDNNPFDQGNNRIMREMTFTMER